MPRDSTKPNGKLKGDPAERAAPCFGTQAAFRSARPPLRQGSNVSLDPPVWQRPSSPSEIMITGLPYGTSPALGTFPSYPPVGVPTGPVGGPPALGTWNNTGGGGGAPTIPPFDPSTQIPGIDQITQAINQLNLTAQQAANAARIPNATGLETQSSNLIGQELGGQVPADVISLLQQQGAERGAATGMAPGSPNANAAYLRALGLTSIDQQQRGEANLTSALGRNPGAPIVDPSRFVMTPYQQALLALEQERLKLGYQPRLGVYGGPGSGGGGGGFSYTPDPYVPRTAPPPTFVPPHFPPPDPSAPPPNQGYTDPNADPNAPGTDPSLWWPDFFGPTIDPNQVIPDPSYYDFNATPQDPNLINIMQGYGGDLSNFDFTGYGG